MQETKEARFETTHLLQFHPRLDRDVWGSPMCVGKMVLYGAGTPCEIVESCPTNGRLLVKTVSEPAHYRWLNHQEAAS